MDIRRIVQDKYAMIDNKKYVNRVIFEELSPDDKCFDIIEESIKDSLIDFKNRAITTIKKYGKRLKNGLRN